MVWGAPGDIFSGRGWGRRLVTDRKTSQGVLSSTWRALDENFHSPIEASILQGRKSSFWAVNHLLGGHRQGPVMWAHALHPGGSGCAHPSPRPVTPAANLASWPALPSLPLPLLPSLPGYTLLATGLSFDQSRKMFICGFQASDIFTDNYFLNSKTSTEKYEGRSCHLVLGVTPWGLV